MRDKKYYFSDKNQNIISEDQLVGKKIDDLKYFFTDYQIKKSDANERIFIMKKSLLGLFKLKLHLYLTEDTVYDYAIQI
ncbi:hypothetical protein SAMN05421594_2757 [Chryseobacterium oleae]|uniref:Uncharacterized protein n=1 Tax=Chryseobacterium oleae TaxID=491207 RepID=A0A1I4YXK6_CHROL|nr:hypothetical protein [Chryseobacterium oleae]SFN42796.1 hypothetical protein SAMN05421594_2757 [Chryseobacterium oleae]